MTKPNREKKMAAALAAVQLYLQQEAEAAAAFAPMPASRSAALGASQWVDAMRVEMMSAHRMMQMRAFGRR